MAMTLGAKYEGSGLHIERLGSLAWAETTEFELIG